MIISLYYFITAIVFIRFVTIFAKSKNSAKTTFSFYLVTVDYPSTVTNISPLRGFSQFNHNSDIKS